VESLRKLLPADVRVLTMPDMVKSETEYWDSRTPIGVIITSTMVLSFIVGAVVVFQILYTDVTDHLPEYATLKSIGFADDYFTKVVIQEAVILSIAGFIPGAILTGPVYRFLASKTGIPVVYTLPNLALVLGVSITMCVIAGLGATRQLAHANPADIV
jgi:putative ABC transport system permease protein